MPTIVYDLEANSDDFSAGIGKATSAMKGAVNAAGALSAGVLALGASMRELIADVTDYVDNINTLAGNSGLANDTIKALDLAAQASGKALTDLVPQDLSARIQKAADGGKKMQKAFADLGVAVKDGNGELRNADAVFRDVINQLTAIEDPTTKAALATQVLGSQGQQLLTAFGDVSSFDQFVELGREFGVDVGPDAVSATGTWQKATANLSLAFDTAKQSLFEGIGGTAVSTLIERFSLGFVFLTELVGNVVADVIDNFVVLGKIVGNALTGNFQAAIDEAQNFKTLPDVIGGAFQEAEDKARSFFTLAQSAPPVAADQITTVVPPLEGVSAASLKAEKNVEKLAGGIDKLAAIGQAAGADQLDAIGKVNAARDKSLALIDDQIAKFEELAVQGVDVTAGLAEAEAARTEVLARASRDRVAIREAEIADLQAQREEQIEAERELFSEQIAEQAEVWRAQAEERIALEEQIREATVIAASSILATTQKVTELRIAAAQAEAAEAEANIDRMRERLASEEELTEAQRERIEERIADEEKLLSEQQKAIRKAHSLQQSAAVAQILIDAAVATLALVPAFAFLGPGAPVAAAGVTGPLAAANIAAVLAQQAPSIHDGAANVDEVFGLLRQGEAVLNQRGAETIGRQAVEQANRGVGGQAGQGPQVIQVAFQRRVLDTMVSQTIAGGGETQRMLDAQRAPVGTLNPFGKGA